MEGQILKHFIDVHEIWYAHHSTKDHSIILF